MPSLVAAQTVTLDGAGAGTLRLGPVPPFSRWHVERLVVSTSGGTGTNQAQVRVYRGDVGAGLEDSTYAGNLDTAIYSPPLDLEAGEWLTVAWTVGRPTAVATARAVGTREVLAA